MIRGNAWTAVAAVLVAIVAAVNVMPANAAVRQVALGISVYDYADLSQAETYKANTGRYPAIWAVWSDWGNANGPFPTTLMNDIRARGMVPMVNWQPIGGLGSCSDWSLDQLLSSRYDQYVRDWAIAAKQHGGRILLRYAHEMNGNWFVWGYNRCENTPKKFRKAWKKVVNIFRNVGATNVQFMWSPFGAFKLTKYYPGDAFVDHVGVTAFNWGPDQFGHSWVSMVAAFKPTMRALSLMGNTKPVIAAEMGAAYVPNCATCNKPAWVRDGYPKVYEKWPKVQAIVYFDIDMKPLTGNVQPDWRLTSPTGALAEYINIAKQERFQGALP